MGGFVLVVFLLCGLAQCQSIFRVAGSPYPQSIQGAQKLQIIDSSDYTNAEQLCIQVRVKENT